MGIVRSHIPYYLDILSIDGFLNDPILVIGVQDCAYGRKQTLKELIKQRVKLHLQFIVRNRTLAIAKYRRLQEIPDRFKAKNLQEVLKNYGMDSVKTLDLFDDRADFRFDLNDKLSHDLNGQFNTVIDVGSIEHIFDTKQALWNLFNLVKTEGHLLIHTPCNGFYSHGFHTFSPECLLQAIELNGFSLKYLKYSTPDGIEIENPAIVSDAIIWIVAQKVQQFKEFNIPQQGRWEKIYKKR